MGLSIHLKTGLDYLRGLTIEELSEIAEDVNRIAEEVAKGGRH